MLLNWIYSFSFSSSVEDVTVYLPLVMPVLAARLGTPEITEPSEELRLNYVTYLSSVVSICAAKMAPYLGDMISILQRTLVDPYPEVKKVSHPYNSCVNTHCMWALYTWGDQFSWVGIYDILIFADINRLTIACLDIGIYCSVPLLGKHTYTSFQGINVAASIQNVCIGAYPEHYSI